MTAGGKTCASCGTGSVHGKGLCRRCYNRGYYASQIETSHGKATRRALERAYKRRAIGFADELVETLRRAQCWSCAACGLFMERGCGPLGESADHDHATGAPRGLLCNACNRLVGKHEHGLVVDRYLQAACAAYLADPPAARLARRFATTTPTKEPTNAE